MVVSVVTKAALYRVGSRLPTSIDLRDELATSSSSVVVTTPPERSRTTLNLAAGKARALWGTGKCSVRALAGSRGQPQGSTRAVGAA
jgi:hypothetical protein